MSECPERVDLSRSAEVGGLSQAGGQLSFVLVFSNGEVAPITDEAAQTVPAFQGGQSDSLSV